MESRTHSQADIIFSAGRDSHGLSHGIFFEISRSLHRRTFLGHARCGVGRGIDVMALAIGKESAVFVERHFAADRRFLRGARGAYFPRLVKLIR